MRLAIGILLPLTTFSFALGITLPLMVFEKFFLFEERHSLLAVLTSLWEGDEFVLAVLIALFSIGFPAIKIILLHVASLSGSKSRSLHLLSIISKWSMLDVMLVALVLFAAKTSGIASATILPGLWFYAFAALGSTVVTFLCTSRRS
ncbi:MAG: paraquat-inducible protein A [Rhodobacteraceae bacterium]|nr:paraquat-inducible protein A [Paracoccaceae bacterium]